MSVTKYKKNSLTIAVIVISIFLISACTTTPRTDYYQLNEKPDTSLKGIDKGSVIGIGPIQIAEYINRPQIITRTSAHQLYVSEFHRWIEPLKDNINHLLVTNISNHLNSNRIFWIPREERQYPLELRIAIDIRRLDGELGKTAYLESHWTVFDKNDKPLMSRFSLIEEPVNGLDYNALVNAMNRALQVLGGEISKAASSFLSE